MSARESVPSSGRDSELFRRFAEGELRPDEFHDLEQRLLDDEELRERFVRFRGLEAGLYEIVQSAGGLLHSSSRGPLPYRRLRNWRLAGGVCVAIGLAVFGIFLLSPRDEPPPEPAGGTRTADRGRAGEVDAPSPTNQPVETRLLGLSPLATSANVQADAGRFDVGPARSGSNDDRVSRANSTVAKFSRSVNVEWSAKAHRWSIGDAILEGDSLDMSAGRIELVFDSGAVMTVVGPAKLEMLSGNSVLLQSGTATTRIENNDGGDFRVLTPLASVVDLGTEFGVRVDARGTTDVVVFEGAVDLKPANNSTESAVPARRLSVGEAVSTTGSGAWERLVAIESDAFPSGGQIFNVEQKRKPVIVGVSDDRRSPESSRFYRIYHAAFAEDSRAYVDRLHEWNGVDSDGIPAMLRGADYIATFNDDTHVDRGPTISVELSGPAMLYVLFDNRLVIPGWLSESFENTGLALGIDEGASDEDARRYSGIPARRVSVGPGNSIDQVSSIWRRRIERAGSVELGPLGVGMVSNNLRTMYGIAAQPLERN